MKHHVLLLVDSLQIPGTYITEEYNATEPDNDIPSPFAGKSFKKLSANETREALIADGFVKREFCPPNNPEGIDPEIIKEIGGHSSLVELAEAGTAIITMYYFKANGLPKYQKVFMLELPEE